MTRPLISRVLTGGTITTAFTAAIVGCILACYTCFTTQAHSTRSYYLELDVSNINLKMVFPPYTGYSNPESTLLRYQFELSGLSPLYRFGLFGYCGGQYNNQSEFITHNCTRMTMAYYFNPKVVLRREVNATMISRSYFIDSSVQLPDTLPSYNKMRRAILDQYGGLTTGVGLSLWISICWFSLSYAIIGKTGILEILFLFLWGLNSVWGLACWLSLAAGGATGHFMISQVVKAFNQDTEYGFKAKIGDNFYSFIWISIACQLVSWILLIVCLIVLYKRGRRNHGESRTEESEHNTTSSSSESTAKCSTMCVLGKSNGIPPQSAPLNAALDIPPSYEESQRDYCLIDTFFG